MSQITAKVPIKFAHIFYLEIYAHRVFSVRLTTVIQLAQNSHWDMDVTVRMTVIQITVETPICASSFHLVQTVMQMQSVNQAIVVIKYVVWPQAIR